LPKRQFSLDEQKKQAYLDEHFLYEARELNYCVMFIVSLQFHVGKQVTDRGRWVEEFFGNTGLDHFLLHARNLLEFYYKDDKPHMYARARFYIPAWKPPKKTDLIRELEKRVHGEVTHLGWERLGVPPNGKSWAFVDLAIDLLNVTESFLKALDRSYHSEPIKILRAELSLSKDNYEIMKAESRLTFPDLFSFLS
jgi:hypothetical protein